MFFAAVALFDLETTFLEATFFAVGCFRPAFVEVAAGHALLPNVAG
jgi:hypothetical protein